MAGDRSAGNPERGRMIADGYAKPSVAIGCNGRHETGNGIVMLRVLNILKSYGTQVM